MDKTSSKYWTVCIYLALALATLVAFWQVRNCEFISYDDDEYVTQNPHVNGGITRQSVVWAFTAIHSANWHPLTWLSHMLDCQLFGLDPSWHHLTSLLFHIANTLLLFWVLRNMTGALWPSAFVAALFALHPLHVESVAWISERKDVLSTLFWLLTMGVYLSYVRRPGKVKYLLTLFIFTLGLMAKPMVITLPFVLLLLDYWPLDRFQWARQSQKEYLSQSESVKVSYQRASNWRLIGEKIPLFILAAVLCVIVYIAQQSVEGIVSMETLPIKTRIVNALVSYISYIGKMFYPTRLVLLYPHPGGTLATWQPIVSLMVLAVVSAGIIYAGRRRYLVIGWFWYIGTLVPVIGLVQSGAQAMADRYTYLPSIGIFIMVAWGAAELLAKWRYRKIGLGISAGIVLTAMLICTRMQVRHWQNDITLFGHAVEVTKNNYIMHNNYGIALSEKGRLDEALTHFKEALRIDPRLSKVHDNLGTTFLKQGKLDEAIASFSEALRIKPDFAKAHKGLANALFHQSKLKEAVREYREVLQMLPDDSDAHNDIGIVLARQGKLDEAVTHFTEALRIKPDFADAHNNLGAALARQGKYDQATEHFTEALRIRPSFAVHCNLAEMLQSQGKLNEAVSHYRRAVQIKPDDATVHYNLGRALQLQEKLDEAISHYRQAVQLRPDDVEAHYNLGIALKLQGKLDEAIDHYRQVVQLAPDYARGHNSLGAALFRKGKVDEATIHFSRAVELSPNYPDAHNNLAVALIQQGKYDKAVTHFAEVAQLDPNSALAHLNLAQALESEGRIDEAITHYRKALRLKPDWLSLMNNLAWLLATHKETEFHNPKEAVRLAERACELTNYQEPSVLDTLAAAYAAAGRFPRAIETAEKAINLAKAIGKKDLAEEIQNRLQLYKAGQGIFPDR